MVEIWCNRCKRYHYLASLSEMYNLEYIGCQLDTSRILPEVLYCQSCSTYHLINSVRDFDKYLERGCFQLSLGNF